MSKPVSDAWWTTAFDASYAQRYAHRDDDSAQAEIAGIVPRLLQQSGPVLDACCGGGRHLQSLRQQGVPAWGFDWSLPLLQMAAEREHCAGSLLRADVRQLPFADGVCSAVLLLFTAFGYFDDADNQRTLDGLMRLLAPQGFLLIDLPDPQVVRRTLVPSSQRSLADGSTLHEERWLQGAYVCKRSRWHSAQGWQTREERVRLYDAAEMASLVAQSGGVIESCWSSLRGPQDDDQRRVYWIQASGSR